MSNFRGHPGGSGYQGVGGEDSGYDDYTTAPGMQSSGYNAGTYGSPIQGSFAGGGSSSFATDRRSSGGGIGGSRIQGSFGGCDQQAAGYGERLSGGGYSGGGGGGNYRGADTAHGRRDEGDLSGRDAGYEHGYSGRDQYGSQGQSSYEKRGYNSSGSGGDYDDNFDGYNGNRKYHSSESSNAGKPGEKSGGGFLTKAKNIMHEVKDVKGAGNKDVRQAANLAPAGASNSFF